MLHIPTYFNNVTSVWQFLGAKIVMIYEKIYCVGRREGGIQSRDTDPLTTIDIRYTPGAVLVYV